MQTKKIAIFGLNNMLLKGIAKYLAELLEVACSANAIRKAFLLGLWLRGSDYEME